MPGSKLTLEEQYYIEDKRRQLKLQQAEFDTKKPFARQMKAVLPNISWKPKQEAFINARQPVKWYLGGYKSGKSFSGVACDIWLSYVNKPAPGILVHPTADGIEVTILPLIDEICHLNKIEYSLRKLSTKWIITFKFGLNKRDWGKLILVSGDRPKSLKGPNLAWGHIDEPLIMEAEIVSVIQSRLANPKGKLNQLIFTGTPEPAHMKWGFDIVDKETENTKQRFIITVSTREVEEYLAPGYIKNIEDNNPPEFVETFIDGKYRNLSQGKVYYSFRREKNVFDPLKFNMNHIIPDFDNHEREIVISYDFNVNQMSATQWMLAKRWKLQEEEYRIQGRSNTRELTGLIINRLHLSGYLKKDIDGWWITKYGKSIIVTGDASGKSGSSKSNLSDYETIVQLFENDKIRIQIFVPDVNPAVRDRTNYMNTEFELGYVLISTKCPLSIRDRELTSWKLGADGFIIDKTKKEISHLAEAGDYACWNTRQLTESEEVSNSIYAEYRQRRY
jgi:hypothetical protein